MIGKTISHYKILSKLGEGGMGVVYKAEDTKLERTVALKFLSLASIGDEEKKRFKREAKAAASLNHPNIATIFAIDEADDQTFIAMEYIEGKSLEELVGANGGKPMPIDKAIDYATQTAAGLQAAHEKGITHRDIKSANIMLTGKGVVKIMDFGLAKLTNRSKMTQLGTMLGTIAYMSPEQAQGQKVDHRSDIWSLGVVLYEMISGQMPFKGDYEQAVIYSLQNEEPEPLTALRTGVPMKLEEIVNKLLAKDPKDRYQNIMELPVDLKNVSLKDTTTSRIGSSVITDAISREKQLNVQVKYSYKTILTVAVSIIITFMLTWFLKPGPPDPEPRTVRKYSVPLPDGINFFLSSFNRMAISPAGKKIVYIDNLYNLQMYDLYTGETEEIEGSYGARNPFFSPNGRFIGFLTNPERELKTIPTDGGSPLLITNWTGSTTEGSAAWGPENTIIYSDEGVLKQISATSGTPIKLTKLDNETDFHLYPHMLGDGKNLLFTISRDVSRTVDNRLALYSFETGEHKILMNEESYNGVYIKTGHLLYGRADKLMAVPFDLGSLEITGSPIPVLNSISTDESGSMSYALSQEGTIVYVPDTGSDADLRSVLNVDLFGNPSEFFDQRKLFLNARYSPDGKYVGFVIRDSASASNVWIYNIEGGALNQLTFYKGSFRHSFAWSPDRKTIAYATMAEDSTNSIFLKKIDGTGAAQKIYTASQEFMDVHDWSGDGEKISFTEASTRADYDIFIYSFQDSSAKPYLSSPAWEIYPEFSPNGKWLTYVSNESGTSEVYVRPYPKSRGGVWKISNGVGSKPVWSPDGKKIYYQVINEFYSVDVTATATNEFSKGNPKKIFEGNYLKGFRRRWDIHPDGDRFIMIQVQQTSQQDHLFVIENFLEELKRLAPVNKD